MKIFSDKHISVATETDIPLLINLLNSAYRGEESKKGWTSEAHLIAGEVRSDEASLKKIIQSTGSVLLKYTDAEKKLIGCVNLQQHVNKIYLGMFSVSPLLQGGGIGKKLLVASEEYTSSIGCPVFILQ
jgi:predicted N-acetyltransferase YhbS